MRRRSSGQGLVEFALVSLVLMIIFLGIMDFGFLFAGRVASTNAVRAAARFAAANPTAWSNSANPPITSIQGNLKLTAIPAVIINDDTHVTINYLVPGTGTAGVVCGRWSSTTNTFVANGTYTQATCVTQGNIIQIQAIYVYTFITPMLSVFTNVTLTSIAAEIEET